MEEIKSPTPVTEATATPATQEPLAPANGTAEKVSDASTKSEQTAPDLDTLEQVDPNSLTPRERNLLRDYKKKTAEIAAQRKEHESQISRMQELEEKAMLADQLASDPDIVQAWNAKYGQANAQPQQRDPVQEIDVLKANLLVKDFKTSHPDFEELDKHNLITGYVKLNPPSTEREWKKTLEAAYKYAKTLKETWYEDGRKSGLQRVEEKVAQSTNPPSTSPSNVYAGGDPAKISVAEAVDMARRGIKVPRR